MEAPAPATAVAGEGVIEVDLAKDELDDAAVGGSGLALPAFELATTATATATAGGEGSMHGATAIAGLDEVLVRFAGALATSRIGAAV